MLRRSFSPRVRARLATMRSSQVFKAAASFEAFEPVDDAEPRVPDDVLGDRARGYVGDRDPQHQRAVAVHERHERVLVAGAQTRQQVRVGVRDHVAHRLRRYERLGLARRVGLRLLGNGSGFLDSARRRRRRRHLHAAGQLAAPGGHEGRSRALHRPEPASGPLFATALSAPPPTRTFEALRPPAPPPPPRSEERTQPLPPRHLWDDPPRRDDDEDDPPRGLWSGWAR